MRAKEKKKKKKKGYSDQANVHFRLFSFEL
jgi:hypothetical protein